MLFASLAFVACSGESSSSPTSGNSQFQNSDYTGETITDFRDGQVYKVVTIGSQTWMAQNLNYETANSYCYKDDATNCIKYGRLYTWAAAKKACPSGWHLPSKTEWENLFTAVGGISTAGKVLKSTSGWSCSGNGTDVFGFSALPVGFMGYDGEFTNGEKDTYFWSSSESEFDSNAVDNAYLTCHDRYAFFESGKKNSGFSVRCLKDELNKTNSSSSQTSSSSMSYEEKISSMGDTNGEQMYDPANVKKGTVTDSRDGKTYKTVTIGSQTWMAENLAYGYKVNNYLYGVQEDEYDEIEYGFHYTWAASMDSAGLLSTDGKGCGLKKECSLRGAVRGICPEGWHLPASEEWLTLYNSIGKSPYALQIENVEKWKQATNTYDFSAYPAGGASGFRSNFFGENAYFWTASECGENDATLWYLTTDEANIYNASKRFNATIRCLRDDSEPKVKPSCIIREPSSSSSTSNSLKPEQGTMTDARDGKIYKTVKIGEQIWMAENLNFDYKVNGISYGMFYEDSLKQYGRYYDWGAAMDSAAIFSENGKGCGIWSKEKEPCNPVYPLRGVCPEGWHLPDSAEWKELFKAMDESAYAMEAVGFEGWPHATDAYGFSALPAGVYGEETLYDLGSAALFSTSTASCDLTQGGESTWWCVTVRWLICAPCGIADDGRVIANGHGADVQKSGGYLSVRCLKD